MVCERCGRTIVGNLPCWSCGWQPPKAEPRSQNVFAAVVAVTASAVLLFGAVVVARSTPSRSETRRELASISPTPGEPGVVDDGVYTFAEGQGYQMVCSALRVQKTFVGTTGLDGPVQDAKRANWGPQVAPGDYRAVIVTDITVPCIEVPPTGSSTSATVLGAEEWDDTTQAL